MSWKNASHSIWALGLSYLKRSEGFNEFSFAFDFFIIYRLKLVATLMFYEDDGNWFELYSTSSVSGYKI